MYKLYKELLRRRSGFFETLLAFPLATAQNNGPVDIEDGSSDERGIQLDRFQPHSAVDFESLLNFIHTSAS